MSHPTHPIASLPSLAVSLLAAACLLLGMPAAAHAIAKGDPGSGDRRVYVDNGSADERFRFCDDDAGYTRWRWVDGVPAYCLNPAIGSRDSGYMDARTLKPSDFSSERAYRNIIATLYYAPGGPGYETAGKALFPSKRYDGGAMDEDQRMATAHVLMAYYYNASWDEVWNRYSGPPIDPSDAYTSWFRKNVAPNSDGNTLADKIQALANDNDMLAHGGYTFDEFAARVILVLTGYIGNWPYQDLITWEKPERGSVSLLKASANPTLSDNNACYSLKGAVYGIFSSEADAKGRNAAKAVRTGTTGQKNADGTQKDNYFTTAEELPVGSYWVSEISPPRGFAQDGTIYKVTVRAQENTRVNASKSQVEEMPLFGNAALWVAKLDAETGAEAPQGSASLAGAQFTIRYYDGTYTASNLPETPVRTWIVKTDGNGKAAMEDASRVSGDAFYHHNGKVVVPLGTLSIVETKAPAGYRLDDGSGNPPKVHIVNITGNNGALVSDYQAPTVKNTVKHMGFTVAKIDKLMNSAQAEGDASLDGAVFSVVNTSPHAVVVNGRSFENGQECLEVRTAAADGRHLARVEGTVLPYGSYLIREKTPPAGYLANKDWSATLKADENTPDGHVVDLTATPCADTPVRGGITVPKIDREAKAASPLGAASLAGAKMALTLESDQPVCVNGSVFAKGDTVAVIATGKDGTAATDANALPYATYSIREIEPPPGYLLNETWEARIEVREEGTRYETKAVDDQVKRGDIRFNKVHGENMGRMGGVAFLITSKTTGESHVAVTDKNGSFDSASAWARHSHRTNANDKALGAPVASKEPPEDDETASETQADSKTGSKTAAKGGSNEDGASEPGKEDGKQAEAPDPPEEADEEHELHETPAEALEVDDALLDAEAGLWFSGQNGTSSKPNDSLGALPYDTYLFTELRGAANAGMKPLSFEVQVYRDSYGIDMGTVDNAPASLGISTELKSESGGKTAPASKELTLIDTVSYHGLEAGTSYELRGVLMDGDTGKEAESGGHAIYGSSAFTAPAESGKAEVSFSFDASGLAGKKLVAYQELYLNETCIAAHKDLDDAAQTVNIPRIATVLSTEDGGKTLLAQGPLSLVDRVDYRGLEAGRTYTLTGTLHQKAQDGSDAGPLTDAKGNEVAANTEFTPENAQGSTSVEFRFELPVAQSFEVVAFEELALEGTPYATHADIGDESQTVSLEAPPQPQENEEEPEKEPEEEPKQPQKPEVPKEASQEPAPQRTETPSKASTPTRNAAPTRQTHATLTKTGDARPLFAAAAALGAIAAAGALLHARRRQKQVRQINWVWNGDFP